MGRYSCSIRAAHRDVTRSNAAAAVSNMQLESVTVYSPLK